MLEDTLVIWGGEFGRTPTVELNGDGKSQLGRDHNHYGFSVWMAGGGIKGGTVHGATDDFGLQGRRGPGQRPRPPRHDPPPARLRPRAAHLPLRRPGLPPDRRPRQGREGHPRLITPALASIPRETMTLMRIPRDPGLDRGARRSRPGRGWCRPPDADQADLADPLLSLPRLRLGSSTIDQTSHKEVE